MNRQQWIAHVAKVLGLAESHVFVVARIARLSGMVSTGRKRRYAPPFTENDKRAILERLIVSECLGRSMNCCAAEAESVSVVWDDQGLTAVRGEVLMVSTHIPKALLDEAVNPSAI